MLQVSETTLQKCCTATLQSLAGWQPYLGNSARAATESLVALGIPMGGLSPHQWQRRRAQ